MNSCKKHSILFRGMILVVAFALSILCFPINNIVFADATLGETDYRYITIKEITDKNTMIVNKGATYTIRDAFIGGNEKWRIGDDAINGKNTGDADVISSDVTVSYNGADVAVEDGAEKTFKAENEGTYVITYSYKYKIGTEEFVNSYDLEVQSVLSSASIGFASNNQIVMPSVLDLSVKGAKNSDGSYKSLYIPLPEIKDENGDIVEEETDESGNVVKQGVKFVTELPADSEGNYVVLTANGGRKVDEVEISKDDKGFFISGDYFKGGEGFANYGAGNYTVKFSYYTDGHFVTSTTKTTQVFAENDKKEDNYYQNYKLNLELASDWVDNGQTGVERSLPAAVGVTSKDSTPASEKVDVAYKVEVLFTSNKSESGYKALSAEQIAKYNADEENPVFTAQTVGSETRYYLTDPTKFKPLEDGNYTFIYTITDFYGNTVSSAKGAYEYENIKDEQKPTPVIYDASAEKDEDGKVVNADYKLASQTPANAVVVYAIGMEDNVSKVGDKDVELSRKVMTDETVVKFTIKDYDSYNLVFNYRQTDTTDSGKAYANLLHNNFGIRKAVEKSETTVDSDSAMLEFLKQNKYLIVIDNANIQHIFDLFKTEGETVSFMGIEGVSTAEELKTWLKSKSETEISALGFAYIDVDTTFGARAADNGMGTGYYYIHYVAKDAAGNETDMSRRMQIGVDFDEELPTIKFGTTLQTAYTPSSKVKFDVPTSTDTQDSSMLVRTMYRYFNGNDIIEVKDKSIHNLVELRQDLDQKYVDDELLTKTYDEYLKGDADGYIELTDRDATSYEIDLSEAKTATKLQIVVFVYDDFGNANIYAQTVDIAYANDNHAPEYIASDDKVLTYDQGARIELPTMVVRDDAVAHMGFDVKVKYFTADDKIENVETTGFYAERKVLSLSGAGEMTVHGGSFVAGAAGRYQATISVKDSAGRTVVKFVNYEVKSRIIIEKPQINASLPKTQTLELNDFDLNDTIEIPAPTVTYDIQNSVTYDKYMADKAKYDADSKTNFVVYGVDANGKPLNYSTTFGQAGSLKPRELGIGEYDLQYKVDLLAYNHKVFEFKEMEFVGGKYTEGGLYYKTARIDVESNGNIVVYDAQTYTLRLNEDKTVDVLNKDGDVLSPSEYTSAVFAGVSDLKSWFSDVQKFTLTSDIYNIKIQDTKGPVIAESDYPTAISIDKLAETKELTVYGIQASDASGIDMSKSSVVLSWKLANGTSNSKEWKGAEAGKNQVYKIPSTVMDGTYKVTYTVYDNQGNYSTKEYTIAVGDNIAPTMTVSKDFIKETYEIGSELKIDLSAVVVKDNNTLPENTVPTITLKNTSTGEEIKLKDSSEGLSKYFDLNTAGSYTLTMTVEDAVGNTATKEFNFEVAAKTQDTTTIYKAVGTVLIVVSVLVLAGVIVYFVVSKVKLDKELKK